ncbi:MAG: glycoside hydrolase family 27 protein [Acidobacteriota bacterium]|nr:glycoside hydrolase family 27 protein [Acidobacteriota bacterium]
MKSLFLFILLAPCALSAQTGDISGTWVAKMSSPMGDAEVVYELKVDSAGKITGTQKLPFGDSPIVDGHVEGDKVTMIVETENFGTLTRSTATAVIAGDELQITPAMPDFRGRGGPGGARGPGGPGGPPDGMPPPGAGGPGRGNPFGGVMIAHRGVPTPSYRAPSIDYAKLPKVDLPVARDLGWNHLATTPPMGWNSWNKFHANIDGKTVREIADAMVSSGMKAAGYTYVNIDDGWQGRRDEAGRIQANPNFPDMKGLAAYVHSKGLKIGIYSSPGPRTCGGYEGSYGHEAQDAKTWAEWGIDYLKYDWCSASRVWKDEDMRAAYQKMGEALRASGKPIVFSLCQYGRANVSEWGPLAGGNLYRTTGDIRDAWQSMASLGFAQSDLARFTKPGWWPDPDMLEIGNGGMTPAEYRTHLSLWSMVGAPLIAGNDLRSMTPEIRDILTNREVLAVDQDKLGKGGTRIASADDTEVWTRPLAGGALAVALFNRGDRANPVSITWAAMKLNRVVSVRDLWAHAAVNPGPIGYDAVVPSHGVVLLRIKGR